MMNWDDIRIFVAVAKQQSIRGAAKVLNASHATVSRRIKTLEQDLGTRLFERTDSGYIPTLIGEAMLAHAEHMEDEATTIERVVVGKSTQLSGTLRVTLPEPLLNYLLIEDIRDFANQFPRVQLELHSAYESFNLTKREADVAIRMVKSMDEEHLVGRRMGTYYRAVYASKDYLENTRQHGQPQWIGRLNDPPAPPWLKHSAYPQEVIHHRASNIMVEYAAARAGLGMSMLPCFLGDAAPELVRLADSTQASGELWVLTHPDLRYSVRIKLFMEHITQAVKKHANRLAGVIE